MILEIISKKSFVPISALGAHFKSSKYQRIPPACDPQSVFDRAGSPAQRGNAAALIWDQDPNFEMTSNNYINLVGADELLDLLVK
jgi:hypothetical protein